MKPEPHVQVKQILWKFYVKNFVLMKVHLQAVCVY